MGSYPIPEREIAVLIQKLPTYKPRVIGLDILRNVPVPGHLELVFYLALRLAKNYLSQKNITLENGIKDCHAMRFGTTELPRSTNFGGYVGTDAGGVQVLLNSRNSKFHILSLNQVKTGKFDPSWIGDRIIIIGITSPGLYSNPKSFVNSR